jgi:MFS family permease
MSVSKLTPIAAHDRLLNSPQFLRLCLSSFLFFGGFNMIIPELPNYLSKMGGEEYKGLIIALFTTTAGLARPFSGKLADKIGRMPVMVVGALVSTACTLLYPVLSAVLPFLVLRFFHGFSTGFTPTGNSAYVADLVPVERRGEAMGIVGASGSTGMAMGPALGSYLAATFSLETMFYCSALVSLTAVLLLVSMQESLAAPQRFRLSMLRISPHEVFEKSALPPAFVMLFASVPFGAVLTVIPDFSVHLGMENKGLFFSFFTLASIGVRLVSGKMSDRLGRVKVLKMSVLILILATVCIAFAFNVWTLMGGAFLFGIGMGMSSPSLLAWTVDLSTDERRARSLATMYIALELGIGSGALISAQVYRNQAAHFPHVFLICAASCSIALLYLLVKHSSRSGKA